MKPIKNIVNRLIAPAARKRGLVNGKILLEWDKIVGGEFASWCMPLKVQFQYKKRNNGVLHLKVNPSHALLITHSKDLVVEKVNTYFGYKAIQDIKIFQMPFTPQNKTTMVKVKKRKVDHNTKDLNITPQERLHKALIDLETCIKLEEKKRGNTK